MLRPWLFLLGYVSFSVRAVDVPYVVELLGRNGMVYGDISFDGEYASFDCTLFSAWAIERLLKERGIDFETDRGHGVPCILWRYRHRYGVLLGIFIFLFLLIGSNFIIWDVRVIGNTTLDEEDVKAELKACGFGVGEFIPSIDTPMLESTVLINSDSIAWISINIVGCVAEVEIQEAVPEPPENEFYCTDLVADMDGVIELFEDTRGNALVNIGDSVKKGDVLISGYYPEDEYVGERFTVAKGKVLARTKRDFFVSIPLKYEKKTYTGRKKCEKYFILFEKEVKFFTNSRNLYANCDTISTVEYFELPGGVLLPFGIRTVEYAEYENTSAVRSEESAIELALYTLRCQMSGVEDGTLVKKEISSELTEAAYNIRCTGEYIENIAVVTERKE